MKNDARGWCLELGTELDIEALAYLRHRDGVPIAMHDLVPLEDGRHRVPFFNPASNWRQVSLLRSSVLSFESGESRIS